MDISQSSYARRFPVVEVQHTFYEPPADAMLARWRAQVPPSFEFTIKAWQVVTHESGSANLPAHEAAPARQRTGSGRIVPDDAPGP